MSLSPASRGSFKALWKEHYGVDLSDQQAEEYAKRLLTVVRAVLETPPLRDGTLYFAFAEPFSVLIQGKVAMAEAIHPLQLTDTLDIPLADVKKETLDRVSSVWSSLLELIRN